VAIREKAAQAAPDDEPAEDAAEDAEGRVVFDVVDEERALGMRLDDVAMTPGSKWTAHLLILE
jgi:hypothetical protein